MHDHTSILSGPRGCQTRKVREVARRKEKLGKTVPTVGFTRPSRGPRRCSTSGRIASSYARISGTGGSLTSWAPDARIQWPLPGEMTRPLAVGRVLVPELKPVCIAERWLQGTWYRSPPKFSAGNFQLQGTTHLCRPPITSIPPSRRSKKASRYQVISPRYVKSGGASGSKVANSSPL